MITNFQFANQVANQRRMSKIKTADNSPSRASESVGLNFSQHTQRRQDINQILASKIQPKKTLERLRKKIQKDDIKFNVGREAAFGEMSTVHVKPLKKE